MTNNYEEGIDLTHLFSLWLGEKSVHPLVGAGGHDSRLCEQENRRSLFVESFAAAKPPSRLYIYIYIHLKAHVFYWARSPDIYPLFVKQILDLKKYLYSLIIEFLSKLT